MRPTANPVPASVSIPDAETMHQFGRDLAGGLRAGDLIVLTGPLGAGKTTLARGLGEGLRVRGAVTSPTFVLARTHPSAVELDDLDIDFAGSVVVVEWGRGMLGGITDSWLDIEIERPLGASEANHTDTTQVDPTDLDMDLDEPRTVTITAVGPRWAGAFAGERAPGGRPRA